MDDFSALFVRVFDLRGSPVKQAPLDIDAILATAAASSLPAPDTRRWSIRRKAAVVAAIRAGVIGIEEACLRYELTNEELLSWQKLIERHGLFGLRVTRLKRVGKPISAVRCCPRIAWGRNRHSCLGG